MPLLSRMSSNGVNLGGWCETEPEAGQLPSRAVSTSGLPCIRPQRLLAEPVKLLLIVHDTRFNEA